MKLAFRFNDSDYVYFIHGQPAYVDYVVTGGCLFVIIISFTGKRWWNIRLSFKKASSRYHFTTNASKPSLIFIKAGRGISSEALQMKVNFINTLRQTVKIDLPKANHVTPVMLRKSKWYKKPVYVTSKLKESVLRTPEMEINKLQILEK